VAKKRAEDPPKGSPAWMATFSDLMNLLLCFFVLLFSMSTVDAEKLQEVVASMQNTVSILPGGSSAIGDGQMISAGVRQLEFLDDYYNEQANSAAEDTDDQEQGKKSVTQAYEEQSLAESEEMAENMQAAIESSGLGDEVEIDFNAEYVQLNLSGAILFESGKADLIAEAVPIVDKIGKILETYDKNIIEVEGHTDNVPIHSAKYANNEVLSMYRALAVTERIRDNTSINPKYLKFAGRGDYVPVADNNTAEGRARNRRVEIKVYNTYNSDLGD
jgi:chemotaxis protein MotB